MSDTEQNADQAGTPESIEAKSEAPSAPTKTPQKAVGAKLIVVCGGLWVVAVVLFFFLYPSLRLNYYLGNITQSLVYEGQIDPKDVEAVVSMGPSVVPELVKEFKDPTTDIRLCVGIMTILGHFETEELKGFYREALAHQSPQVRANACLHLTLRLEPSESAEIIRGLLKKEDALARRNIMGKIVPRLKDQKVALGLAAEQLADPDFTVRLTSLEYIVKSKKVKLSFKKRDTEAPKEAWQEFAGAMQTWLKGKADNESAPAFPKWSLKKPAPREQPKKPEAKPEKASGEGAPNKPKDG